MLIILKILVLRLTYKIKINLINLLLVINQKIKILMIASFKE